MRLDLDPASGERSLAVSISAWTGKELGARFELQLPLAPGVHESRDVMLAPAPVLLAGVIIDREGKPVPGAKLHIAHEPADNPGCFKSTSIETDERGAFERREHCAAHELLVRVARVHDGGRSVRVQVGDTGLRLLLGDEAR